jgi:hypothetical protein
MPPRRPKDKGTDAERAVARYLQAHGWPSAERRALRGRQDAGDITGTPGVCWEVKAYKRPPGDGQVDGWMVDTECERGNADADFGVLIVRRPGYSEARVDRWWAYLPVQDVAAIVALGANQPRPTPAPLGIRGHFAYLEFMPTRMALGDVVRLLRSAGYGEPLEEVTRGDL